MGSIPIRPAVSQMLTKTGDIVPMPRGYPRVRCSLFAVMQAQQCNDAFANAVFVIPRKEPKCYAYSRLSALQSGSGGCGAAGHCKESTHLSKAELDELEGYQTELQHLNKEDNVRQVLKWLKRNGYVD